MYRLTKKAIAQRQKLEAMRIGRERARMARPVEEREPGEDTGMSDGEWDTLAHIFYLKRDAFPGPDYAILHHPDWAGGSLFFLKRDDCPEWARKELKC